ncbi:urease accessory protein UreD [Undibacterium sp.]|jgi:urease accessory protein|uniref:urease accessory protein UreD n=1 Tax=Undibacterium sp. TaxID=1914977 RepID=UPI002C797899|nr:urease accessory protein UreD [Undibacterium sp.]HTD05350.1 urease accessory protein UreD [Undibacterium sp.]
MTQTELLPDSQQEHPAPAKAHWQASLQLGFSNDQGATRLTERLHSGPLRVQKPLYPEGPKTCHAIIIHPPGGVVGGDILQIRVKAGNDSHALITTPGAAKWYRSNGHISQQHIQLDVAAGAKLEWLPQEAIFFDDAQVELHQTIHLARDACYIGGDILCFGRTASGEIYHTGKIMQHSEIRREGKLIWFEQGSLAGGSSSMHSPLALAGKTVCATVIASGASLNAAALGLLREQAWQLVQAKEQDAQTGASQLKSLIVARYLGNSSEVAKHWMTAVWQHLRPAMIGMQAVTPRIWNT